jgi:hypothetical protein
MEALLGGALGALARLAPEVLKVLDRKNERKHELALNAHQLELVKIQGHQKLETEQLAADNGQVIAGIQAIQAAYENMKTGFKFADTISALVRPWVTFMIVHVWLAVKVAAYTQLIDSGITWDVAMQAIWNADDMGVFSGVVNFWFLGRVFDKRNGR